MAALMLTGCNSSTAPPQKTATQQEGTPAQQSGPAKAPIVARFDCDTLKIAMIKDEYVALSLDAHLYEVVCRFEPAP